MFDRIYAWLLAILISIFPSLNRYSPALDWKAATKTVLTAVQEHDIDTIEAFMCQNIKDNVPNLHAEIGRLIDAVQGKFTRTSSEFFDDYSAASGGRTVMRAMSISRIYTSAGVFKINIVWEYYNNYLFEARGIRDIYLGFGEPGEEKEILARIKVAT